MTDDANWVWMNHQGGVPAAMPAAAAAMWAALGWKPCDPPAEHDPALIEYEPPVRAVEDQAEIGDVNKDEEMNRG